MKKKEEHDIWYNLDGKPFVDMTTGDYLMPLQNGMGGFISKLFNVYYLNGSTPVYAYPNLDYRKAKRTLELVQPHVHNSGDSYVKKFVKPEDKEQKEKIREQSFLNFGTWLILHTDFRCDGESDVQADERYVCACYALRCGVNLLDELKDAFNYPLCVWEAIAVYAIFHRYNLYDIIGLPDKHAICKKFRKDMSPEQAFGVIRPHVMRIIRKNIMLPLCFKEFQENIPGHDVSLHILHEAARISPRRGRDRYNPEYPYDNEDVLEKAFFKMYNK